MLVVIVLDGCGLCLIWFKVCWFASALWVVLVRWFGWVAVWWWFTLGGVGVYVGFGGLWVVS